MEPSILDNPSGFFIDEEIEHPSSVQPDLYAMGFDPIRMTVCEHPVKPHFQNDKDYQLLFVYPTENCESHTVYQQFIALFPEDEHRTGPIYLHDGTVIEGVSGIYVKEVPENPFSRSRGVHMSCMVNRISNGRYRFAEDILDVTESIFGDMYARHTQTADIRHPAAQFIMELHDGCPQYRSDGFDILSTEYGCTVADILFYKEVKHNDCPDSDSYLCPMVMSNYAYYHDEETDTTGMDLVVVPHPGYESTVDDEGHLLFVSGREATPAFTFNIDQLNRMMEQNGILVLVPNNREDYDSGYIPFPYTW